MTYEEATEVGEEIIAFYDLVDTEEEAMEILLEATEKQIPKKPDGKDGYNCGKCGAGLFNNDRYCWKCGQAIEKSDADGR